MIRGSAFLALALLGAGAATPAAAAAPAGEPLRLVLVLAIDQLRADRLDASLPGGLGRLAREGRVFTQAELEHADTETCPGHATMLTGSQPGPAGIPTNEFIDRATGEKIYCVQDDSPDGLTLGGRLGRSPRLMRVDALGDWMKAARPGTRVFAVSAKDRAAITLGGKHPDAAFWLDQDMVHGFTTSRWYLPEVPPWLAAFDGADPPRDGWLAKVPERWDHEPGAARAPAPDDFPGESTKLSRTSGHPLRAEDLGTFVQNVYASPFVDRATLDLAREIVTREGLGRGPQPDLLAISLSATDLVGHLYGPDSQEARDALLRLDGWLGEFLDAVDEQVGGRGRVLIALTADHGVLPLPEWMTREGRNACPVSGGRIEVKWFGLRLLTHLHLELSPFSWPESWMLFASYNLTVNRALAARHGIPPERVAAAAKTWLEAQPSVERVWPAEQIARGIGPEPYATLYRNSFDPDRSGDLVLQPMEDCLFSVYDTGTSHGTPYAYDRAVPLLFFGPGVEPGRIPGRAAPVDVGPTLAARLRVTVPPGREGRPLPLAGP